MDLPTMSSDFKPKSFWERKEGTTGMVVSALLVAGLGAGLYKLLPFLVSILQNAVLTVVFGLGLTRLLYLITNKQFRTVVSYAFQSAMRKLTSLWATVDPIGILKNYRDNFLKELRNADRQISILSGRMSSTDEVIDENNRKKEEALERLKIARQRGNQKEITLMALEAGRLDESNRNLARLVASLKRLYERLVQVRESTDTIVRNLSSTIDIKEREYQAMRAGYSAMQSIMKIMRGLPDEKELFDEAMRFLADDYAMKLGEMKDFLRSSAPVITSCDLENQVYVERALRMLEGDKASPALAQIAAPDPARQSLLDSMLADSSPTPVKETVVVERTGAGNSGSTYTDVINDGKEVK